MRKLREVKATPVAYIYNAKLQARLEALDSLRSGLVNAVTRLTALNDRIEKERNVNRGKSV